MSVLSAEQFKPVYASAHGSAKVTPSGYVMNVHVRTEDRGHGEGTALMQQITGDADRMGKRLTLNARPELHPWYGRLGFEVDPKADDTLGPLLVRVPR